MTRTPLPEHIREAPELYLGLDFFFEAFFDLSGDRPLGMGCVGAIPHQTLRGYAEWNELDGEDLEEFIYMLRAMDKEFLAYNQEEQERNRDTPATRK